MFGFHTRVLSQGMLALASQPQIVVQQAGPHASVHYMTAHGREVFDLDFRVTGCVLVNHIFRQALTESGDATSLRAADCTLTDPAHAEFARSLPHLTALELARGTITNVALNALLDNCPELKVISLQGEDCKSGPANECLFEHPLSDRPAPLPALKDRHLGLFDLRGYSSLSGILEYIKGAEIDRLVLSASLMNLAELNAALLHSRVHEVEFVSNGYASLTPPESMEDLPNLGQLPLRLLGQEVDRSHLNGLIEKLGNQTTVLDLANCRTLIPSDLEAVAGGCPKLTTLSLFNCDGISSEKDPLPEALVRSLTKVVQETPVDHVVLGWDNDLGGPTYGTGPSPKDLIPRARLQAHLSQAAQRQVTVTLTTWYPSSKLLDERTVDARM